MSNPEWSPVRGTLKLGAMSGLRTMAAPATVMRAARQGNLEGLEDMPFGFLDSPLISKLVYAMAAGELVADKLPFIGDRTAPPALLGRAGAASLVGAALFASAGRNGAFGAALGSVSAIAGAFAGNHLRAVAGKLTGAPDPILGVLEDGIVLVVCARFLHNIR